MIIVDFHAHILPGLDHGSRSSRVTSEQLELAKQSGVNKIVATSHFYPHSENPEKFLARRKSSYEKLLSILNEDSPEVLLGAEVLICDNIEEMPHLDELCLEGTKILLLELPFTEIAKSHVSSVKSLVKQGYHVVLAHADRYSKDDIERFIKVGAKLQLNADSLDKFFLKKHMISWIDRGVVVAIGSDIHGPDKIAYKHFTRAIKKINNRVAIINEQFDAMWDSNKK